MKTILEQTKDLYLSNANFDSIPNNLSANELAEIMNARKILATQQADGMLNEVMGDNNCRPAHY
jgi:hypothetical protein